jgi:PLD-like domain
VNAVAIANNDIAVIAWNPPPEPIDHCLGFAVYRIDLASGGTTTLGSWIGFRGQSNPDWKPQPTEVWPVQDFQWRDLEGRWGSSYRYRVVPMIGTLGDLSPHPTIAWQSNPVHLTPNRGSMLAYVNRGILSTQALARQLPRGSDQKMYDVLKGRIDQPGDPLRDRLAGQLIEALTSLLDRARQEGGQCYAALYELNDPELEKLLIGNPALHLILTTAGNGDSENRPARQALMESHTDVINRMIPAGHIGHNKFVVYVDRGGTPRSVMTGSTNWTYIALCAQSNNAVIVEDDQVAAVFLDYWNRLKADTLAAGDDPERLQSLAFRISNQTPHDVDLGGGASARVWFSPNTRARIKTRTSKTPLDLDDVFDRIAAARQAILFLVFDPGEPSIIDPIAKAQAANPALFVRGAVTNPGTAKDFDTELYDLSGTKPVAVVVPATAIENQFSYWEHELLKDPWGYTIIHDKILVIDPFSPDSVVVVGSHNLGYASSYDNDENLVIFRGASALALAYAASVLDVYEHYRFRYEVEQNPRDAWSGLATTPDWQEPYFQPGGDWQKVAGFWEAGIAAFGAGGPSDAGPSRPGRGPSALGAKSPRRRAKPKSTAPKRKAAGRRPHPGRS